MDSGTAASRPRSPAGCRRKQFNALVTYDNHQMSEADVVESYFAAWKAGLHSGASGFAAKTVAAVCWWKCAGKLDLVKLRALVGISTALLQPHLCLDSGAQALIHDCTTYSEPRQPCHEP